MDIVNLVISLVSGALGGNVAGAAAPEKSLGTAGNSIIGLLGGGLGTYVLQALNFMNTVNTATGGHLDFSSILANVGTSAVSGGLLTFIVGLIKDALKK